MLRSLCQSISQCKPWATQGGKSKASFVKTLDDRFVLKVVPQIEFDMFLDAALPYFKYLSKALFQVRDEQKERGRPLQCLVSGTLTSPPCSLWRILTFCFAGCYYIHTGVSLYTVQDHRRVSGKDNCKEIAKARTRRTIEYIRACV